MTRKQLLKSKRFLLFCTLEYGIDLEQLQDMELDYLKEYFVKWYECPEMLFGPKGAEREKVRLAIKNRSLTD